MRALLIAAGLALALCAQARAADCDACAKRCVEGCRASARICAPKCKPCRLIEPARCITLAGPRGGCAKHKCATPLHPCGDYCIPQTCHKPAVPWAPCGDACIPPVCHKPATPLRAESCGGCEPQPTGSRDLIAAPCACGKCGGKSKQTRACAKCGSSGDRGAPLACSADGWAD